MNRFALLAALVALPACTEHLRESVSHAWHKDMQRWHARDRMDDVRTALALDRLYPTYAYQQQQAEREVCLHPNSAQRVVVQDGVSDRVDYVWCVMEPYGDNAGQRLDGRPGTGS